MSQNLEPTTPAEVPPTKKKKSKAVKWIAAILIILILGSCIKAMGGGDESTPAPTTSVVAATTSAPVEASPSSTGLTEQEIRDSKNLMKAELGSPEAAALEEEAWQVLIGALEDGATEEQARARVDAVHGEASYFYLDALAKKMTDAELIQFLTSKGYRGYGFNLES